MRYLLERRSNKRMANKASFAIIVALLMSGCGYHTATGGKLPTNVNAIAIPAFINQTRDYRLEQVMTAAVVKEFITRTKLHVVSDATSDADVTLRGAVTSAQIAPLTYDSVTGRASTGVVTVNMRISLVNKTGRVLYENPNYTFHEEYQVSRDISSFFDEESPAVERMARDFARNLVSDLVESF